jgi:hypothetical protein
MSHFFEAHTTSRLQGAPCSLWKFADMRCHGQNAEIAILAIRIRFAFIRSKSPARTEIPKIADQRLGRASLTPENVADSHTPGNNNTGK